MNNEEDVKQKQEVDKGEVVLPNINVKRNQFFDLDEFNSEEKEVVESDVGPRGHEEIDKNIMPANK